ncbi:MAG: alpha-methylacyl-CoA racemase [Blastococcus sp.]|jgi:alpha-methylacyl-CoA racemase|nr:alpha-methylacyl-CoA racemase [Blastococcus sp.]
MFLDATEGALSLTAETEGPLSGIRIVELPAVGPVPFAAMLMADLGADVIRVDRCSAVDAGPGDALAAVFAGTDHVGRSRRRIAVDLKEADGVEVVLALAERSDVLLEGFRPGVAERLGVGPDVVLLRNPRLVFGRLTGWGQDGPLAGVVGHDIGYLATSGALDGIGTSAGPIAPVGVAGDYPSALLAVVGVLAALSERERSGRGQVVDAAILDTVLLTASVDRFMRVQDGWGPRGTNALDGGSHFYRCYRTADDRWVSFGAVEPQFHDEMLRCLGIDPEPVQQYDSAAWPELAERVQAVIGTATAEAWVARLAGRDVCFAPVLSHQEAAVHPHITARGGLLPGAGAPQAAPAPRFSRTPPPPPRATAPPGAHSVDVLSDLGLPAHRIKRLLASGAVAQAAHP